MKKICLIGSLILLSLPLRAQKFKELYGQIMALNAKAEYEKAIPLALEGVIAARTEYGDTSRNYGVSILTLGILYINTSRFELAEATYLKADSVFKRALGITSPTYAAFIVNLAIVYQDLGKYEISESYYLQSLEIWKNAPKGNYPAYGKCLIGMGVLYERMGKYSKAENTYLQALNIIETTSGKESPDYTLTLNNLAILYDRMGQYERAEPIFLNALEIRKKVLGENHPDYINTLHYLGALYLSMGLYEKAETIFLKTKEMTKQTLGEDSYEHATSLSDLSVLYATTGQYAKAEPLIIETLAIVKKMFGEDHPDYATNLDNLAEVYVNMGQYEKAVTLFTQVVGIMRKTIGEDHPLFANHLSNLAKLYVILGEYDKAEPLFIQARKIRSNTLGESHADYIEILFNMAMMYGRKGEIQKAESLLLEATSTSLKNIRRVFTILSEKEKEKYIAGNISLIETDNSFLFRHMDASEKMRTNNYDLQVFFKSLVLSDTRKLVESIRKSKDSSIQRLFMSWQEKKSMLGKQYLLPAAKRIPNLDSLEKSTEGVEKELTRRSTEFKNQQNAVQISIKELLGALGEDEAAIEYVKFNLQSLQKTDSVIYGVYVLRKSDSIPVFLPLFEEKELQSILDSTGKNVEGMVTQLYRGVEIRSRSTWAAGEKVYKLIWSPLEPFLHGIKKVYYVPAGKLYGLAFQALPVDSIRILMDKYRLQQLTSSRELVLQKEQTLSNNSGIMLFGDPDFTMDSIQLIKHNSKTTTNPALSIGLNIAGSRGITNSTWSNLPGTASEVKKIGQLFKQQKIPATVYTKAYASEENLKSISGHSPGVIHIATHGFFLHEPVKENRTEVDEGSIENQPANDALLRSGLILSGGNYAWSGKAPIDGIEDGIVTAYEISQLDLSNTELVVLSACETALGDIKGSEGVFGLQRAFKMAGAKRLIVSLWQVPDKETAELMTAFYSYWLKGKTIEDAFAQAQADMRKKYSAYYWAAFVLVE